MTNPRQNNSDRIIYRAFMDAPYDGFQTSLAIAHAARACGVSTRRVVEAIRVENPELPADAFDPEWYGAQNG